MNVATATDEPKAAAKKTKAGEPAKSPHAAIVENVRAARRVSVPLVGITTPDPAATMAAICDWIGDKAPLLYWDVVEGLHPRNEPGKDAHGKMIGGELDPTIGNPVEMCKAALRMPENGVLFALLGNRWLQDPMVIQACWNLRDILKRDHRMLVLLGVSMELPPELAGDVVVFDEPLPGPEALAEIVRDQHENASLLASPPVVTKAVEAVQGLSAFQAEQVVAMSLTKDGLDVPSLWERKRRQIELTPGLKVHREPVRFADVGGVKVVKSFLKQILAGQSAPNAIVFIDEIEKFMAGAGGAAGGDSSGVSQDQLGTLLAYMQDQGAAGVIFVGPRGRPNRPSPRPPGMRRTSPPSSSTWAG
jgi:hypothetical protein